MRTIQKLSLHQLSRAAFSITMLSTITMMFRVPKLFLRARYHDGRLLDCQEVQKLLPVGSHEETGKWAFLTYEVFRFLCCLTKSIHFYMFLGWHCIHVVQVSS